MEQNGTDTLPYRTDPEELARWIEARARGRASAQLREQELAPKTLEGTLATAGALGLLERESGELTREGQRFALADARARRELLGSAMRSFPPYARLLDAVASRPDPSVTEARWIETWWATHGHGSSQSNRVEGAATLGRLAEHVGWGRYIPGRRGHPTRIEWSAQAFAPAADAAAPPPPGPPDAPAAEIPGDGPRDRPAPEPSREASPPAARPRTADGDGFNRIAVPLRSGGTARLEVPQRLTRAEKRRLVELLELIISEEEGE